MSQHDELSNPTTDLETSEETVEATEEIAEATEEIAEATEEIVEDTGEVFLSAQDAEASLGAYDGFVVEEIFDPETGEFVTRRIPTGDTKAPEATEEVAVALADAEEADASPDGETPEEELELDKLQDDIVEALRQVYDPEVPVNIYDLGLIYKLELDTSGHIGAQMTLTTPNCPVAETMPGQVEAAILAVEGVTSVQVELVWEPPWSPDMIEEDIRLAMGFF